MRNILLSLGLNLLICGQVFAADYFLKFEASGAALPMGSILKNSGDAWLKLSIVEGFPIDGPIHFPGDRSGVEVLFRSTNGYYLKNQNVNHTIFYVAEVPRSLTIKSRLSDLSIVLTEGGATQTLTGAPAVLLEDGLLVTTALAIQVLTDNTTITQNIYIAAGMPNATIAYNNTNGAGHHTPSTFPPAGYLAHALPGRFISGVTNQCSTGWQKGTLDAGTVEFWQAVPMGANYGCVTTLVYVGHLSHVIRFR